MALGFLLPPSPLLSAGGALGKVRMPLAHTLFKAFGLERTRALGPADSLLLTLP